MEDDVDVWRYAIIELHARNDDDDDDDHTAACFTCLYVSSTVAVAIAISVAVLSNKLIVFVNLGSRVMRPIWNLWRKLLDG